MRKSMFIGCLAVFLAGIAIAHEGDKPASDREATARGEVFQQPKRLAELLALSPGQLDKVDIAVMDILCAEGLPGAEKLDVQQLVKTLDSWERWVGIVTKHNYHRFLEDPKYFNNSEGDYRMAFLSSTLQQDFGVRYNPARAEPQLKGGPYAEPAEVFFANSKDIFIHGLLTENHYGTCSSMPVLFVAVARRLGYPVNLATSKGHFLVRYDEGDHHFNVEATSPGYAVYQDDHYRNWPLPTTDEEIRNQHYFQPLTARETLAEFLSARATCLAVAGRFDKALEASSTAHSLAPHIILFKKMQDCLEEYIKKGRQRAQWQLLTTEISNLDVPEGENYEHFRDAKIGLDFYLSWTGDLDGTEKALASVKMELALENQVERPAQVNLSTGNPPPRPHISIVVMPEKVIYTAIDGEKIELLVKNPEQVQSFLREQRILDKVAEIERQYRQAHGLPQVPWQDMRPTSIQIPPGVPREARLRLEEERLDQVLRDAQTDEKALSRIAHADASALTALPKETQAAFGMIDGINALNGHSRTPASPISPFSGQPGGGLVPPGTIPQELQNTLDLLNNISGHGHVQPGLPPQVQGAFDAIKNAWELQRQMELIQPSHSTNSPANEKAQR